MTTDTILSPFDNVQDADEGTVLAVLAHLEPVLEAWRSGEDCRLERQDLAAEVPELEKGLKSLDKRIARLSADQVAEGRELLRSGPLKVIGGIGLLLTALLFIGLGLAGNGVPWLGAGLAVAAVGTVVLAFGLKRIHTARATLRTQQQALEAERDPLRSSLDTARLRTAELEEEIAGRKAAFPTVAVMYGEFKFAPRRFLGSTVLLDESGHFGATLQTADMSASTRGLDLLVARIADLAKVPVLLTPDAAGQSDVDAATLWGEERELQVLVDAFSTSLGEARQVSLALPLVPAAHPIALAAARGRARVMDYGESGPIPVRGPGIDRAEVAAFVQAAQATRTNGGDVIGTLDGALKALRRVTQSYADARSDSLAHLHEGLFDVLGKGALCSMRFYCPRTIQSPAYLQAVLGIDVETAHALPFDTLLRRLRADPPIAARFESRPSLRDELYAAHLGIHELAGASGPDGTVVGAGEEDGPAHLRSQHLEAIERFRQCLTMALTGSMQPVLAFSERARLFLDPDRDDWRSETAPYVYATPDVLRFGRVPRVTSDLLMPLWEHLWTEKADFRKSELFRTNEMLLAMSEKEAEKLIEIGNQFRADMRTVRENIFHIEADLSSKHDELLGFREGMSALGLLSERQLAFLSDDSLRAIARGDTGVVRQADDFELLLGLEPRAQTERRGTSHDPIEMIRSPSALIAHQPVSDARRLIAS
jgi:hypothetical protein